jgi:hypothetical protein
MTDARQSQGPLPLRALSGLAGAALRPPARLAERAVVGAVEAALRSPRFEEVAERIVTDVLESPVVERLVLGALENPATERIVDDALGSPAVERILIGALESPAAERIVDRVVESPAAERLLARVIDSSLVDQAVPLLLESEDLWILVDEVARSPAVLDAVTHQGAGFADQMAGVVRDRSRGADDRLERAARRLLRRSANGSAPAPAEEP